MFSGTLGDAFTVLCKLYGRHKITDEHFRVIRFSSHPQMDGAIESLFKVVPFTEYVLPCQVVPVDQVALNERLAKLPHDYINTRWDGKTCGVIKNDPEGYPFEPYPEIDISGLSPINRDCQEHKIGIQLHSGKTGSNFRGFSLGWISRLCRTVSSDKTGIYLLGTGEGYAIPQIERFCKKHGIKNFVGRTSFLEWLACIQTLDVFVTMEGFSAFFAMSQKVPTVLYNQYIYGVDGAIHPEWRKNGVIININKNKLLNKIRHLKVRCLKQKKTYSPPITQSVKELIKRA
jgi:hypothetical protein